MIDASMCETSYVIIHGGSIYTGVSMTPPEITSMCIDTCTGRIIHMSDTLIEAQKYCQGKTPITIMMYV